MAETSYRSYSIPGISCTFMFAENADHMPQAVASGAFATELAVGAVAKAVFGCVGTKPHIEVAAHPNMDMAEGILARIPEDVLVARQLVRLQYRALPGSKPMKNMRKLASYFAGQQEAWVSQDVGVIETTGEDLILVRDPEVIGPEEVQRGKGDKFKKSIGIRMLQTVEGTVQAMTANANPSREVSSLYLPVTKRLIIAQEIAVVALCEKNTKKTN